MADDLWFQFKNATGVSKVVISIVLIGAISSGLVAFATALQVGEPHWLATRVFVREQAAKVEVKATIDIAQLAARGIKTEIQVLKGQRANLVGEIKRRELLLKDPTAQVSQEYKNLISDQIESYQEQLKTLDWELDNIIKEQTNAARK